MDSDADLHSASNGKHNESMESERLKASNGEKGRKPGDSASIRPRFPSDNAWLKWLESLMRIQPWEEVQDNLAPWSLMVLSKDNLLRKLVIRLIRWPPFDWIMLLLILANCVTLAMSSNRPGFDESSMGVAIQRANVFFIAAFTVEAVLKIVALDFIWSQHSYLRNGWNVLDLAIVIFGLLEVTSVLSNYTFVRALRILRPLRIISKVPELKIVVEALISSLPMMTDIAFLAMFYYAIFGILCLQIFMGQLEYRCGSPDFSSSYVDYTSPGQFLRNVSYNIVDQDQCCKGPKPISDYWINSSQGPVAPAFSYVGGRQWGYACSNQTYCVDYGNPSLGGYRNFDNILSTWLQLLQHMAPCNWDYIMYSTQGALSWWTWLLHIPMAFFGVYLLMNLTIATLVICFNKSYAKMNLKAMSAGNRLQTNDRDDDVFGPEKFPSQSSSSWFHSVRLVCKRIQATRTFELVIISVIILNVVALSIVWYGMPLYVAQILNGANYAFTMIFVLEMSIKLVGLGVKDYISDSFNVFDGIITILSVIEMGVELSGKSFAAISAFRAARILRLFRLSGSLTSILMIMLGSIVSAMWIAFLLILYLFIIGLLGGILFGYKLDTCSVEGSIQLCPPGLTIRDCPDHFDCYLPCSAGQALQWFDVPDSPYGGQAYCEVFPRQFAGNFSSLPSSSSQVQFWAQVGKAVIPVISGGSPSYDNMYLSMLSVFDLVTQDNYDLNLKLLAVTTGKTWLAALFVVPVVIFGAFAILNLFLAMLLSHLEQMDESIGNLSLTGSMSLRLGSDFGSSRTSEPGSPRHTSQTRLLPVATNQVMPAPSKLVITDSQFSSSLPEPIPTEASHTRTTYGQKPKVMSLVKMSAKMASMRIVAPQDEARMTPGLSGLCTTLEGKSLNLIGPRNFVRVRMFNFMQLRRINQFMNVIIILSGILLCFDDVTVQQGSTEEKVLRGLSIAFVIIFGLEAVLKILIAGFMFNGKGSYMRNGWNILDLFIVIISALVLILEPLVSNPQSLIWLRALKSLRVLRVLRIAMQLEGVRVVIQSMAGTVPWILRILLVASPIYLIFGIIAVNLLMGQMFACTTSSSYGVVDQGLWSAGVLDPYYLLPSGNINKSWCLGDGSSTRVITTDYYHSSINVTVPAWQVDVTWGANGVSARFDNLIMSFVTLFEITVLCNWGYIMGQAMQATGVDSQPVVGANDSIGLFFIVYIFVCCFWILNLIIGIAIRRFRKQKEKTEQSAFLTKKQQEWLNLQRLAASTMPRRRYPKPKDPVRRFFHRAVLNDTFDKLMVVVILLDTVTMFLPHQGMSQDWVNALFACNAAFTAVYALEALSKMMAAGIHGYFTTPWFQFEFFVLLLCGICLLLNYAPFIQYKPTFLPLARVIRVIVLIKILPLVRGLYMMMAALIWSLPAVINVYTVVLVFMFIYTIIGMNLFGNIKFQNEIGYNANFVTFPIAMLVMFRVSTNDDWNYLMQDSMILEDCILITRDITLSLHNGTSSINTTIASGTYLDPVDNSTVLQAIPLSFKLDQCSPSPALAVIFYISFVLIVAFLMVQLFISIVIECIELYISQEEDMLNQRHLAEFMDAWEVLDPESTGFIHASHVASLLLHLKPPLGSKNELHAYLQAQDIIFTTEIPLRRQGVHYLEVLHAVLGRVAGIDLPDDTNTNLLNIMIQRLPPDSDINQKHYVADYYSALKIRSAIKGLIIRARLCELLDTELTDKQDANIPVINPETSLESPFLQPSTTRIVSPFSNSSSKKSFQRLPTQRKVSNPLLRLASRVLSDDDNEELIQIARRSTGDHGRPSNSSSTQFQDFESPSPSNHCVDRVESFSSSPSPIGAQRKSLLKFSTSVERTGSRLGNDAAPILIKSTFSPNVSLLKSQESRGADYGQSRA